MSPFEGVAHVGMVADELEQAVRTLSLTGMTWSSVLTWQTRVRMSDGTLEQRPVRFVTSRQGPAFVKVIESAPGSIWAPTGGAVAVHHLTYWVDDLDVATASLTGSGVYTVEADGLEDDGSVRFRYLTSAQGPRLELGVRANRRAFDSWAAGGEHA